MFEVHITDGLLFSVCCAVYVKSSQDALSPSSSETQEMHRFLVHRPEGGALSTDEDKRALAEMVRSCLLGTRPAHTLSAQWAMGAEGQGLECKSGLLRSLSSRWKGQL